MKHEFTCDQCNSKYSLKKSLIRHYRIKHPQYLTFIQNVKDDDNILKCEECGAKFSLRSSLLKHCKRKNHRRPNVISQNNHRKFICHHCNTEFNIKHNLAHHIKKYHILNKTYKTDNFHCNICNEAFKKYSDLLTHYNTHNIEIRTESLTFKSYSEFLDWKRTEENKVSNNYIKHFASKISKEGVKRDTFYCHRSGTFKSKSKGKRKIKKQGSKKIGNHCPSRMYVKVLTNGEVVVEYISSHVGHDLELCHLTLTSTERLALATKISMNIPFEEILQEVKSSANPTNLKRCDLLTKRDLYNIERCYNLTSFRQNNDGNERTMPTPVDSGPLTENFVETKIQFINDLAQIINDHVNCSEDLVLAEKILDPLLNSLMAKQKKKCEGGVSKPVKAASISQASIHIIHAPTQVFHLETSHNKLVQVENNLQGAPVIEASTNLSNSQINNETNTTHITYNSNGEQETLSLPLINLETIFHSIN